MNKFFLASVSQQDCMEDTFRLHPEALERRITQLRAEGRRVRAFILVNPQNPLGEVYTDAILSQLMDICARWAWLFTYFT